MKTFISSLVLLVVGVSYVSSQACHMRELDLCAATGMFHYQSAGIPDDDEKITEWCDTMKEVKDCMSNFSTKCMSPMQKELISLFVGGASTAQDEFCTLGTELRSKYLKHADCLAQGGESDDSKSNLRDLQVVIEKVFEVEFKDRLPTLCCGALRFHRVSEANTERRCGVEAVEMLRFMFEMIITDLPKTLCSSYDPQSQACSVLLPPSGTQPKGAQSQSQLAKLLDTAFSSL